MVYKEKEQEDVGLFTEVDSLTVEEFVEALRKSKIRKAQGINKLNTELIKYADIMFQTRLQQFQNKCWNIKMITK